MSRSIGCSHLVRVGVSWKTTESRRASGLIAEELHARTSPLLALPLLFVSDPAAKKRARRNCDKNPALCLCRMLTSPLGGKKGQAERSSKSGAVINREQMLPRRRGEENIPRNSTAWRWMDEAEGNEQSISPYYEPRCGGNK